MKTKIRRRLFRNKGFSTLIVMIFLALLATMIISVIQSRLLLAIQRNRSLSDILKAQYASESTINDILRKILTYNVTSFPDPYPTLPDGTEIVLAITGDNPQTFTITAKRPYAVSKIEAVKNTSVVSLLDKMEIVLALDCTYSMMDASDTSLPLIDRTSRLTEEKKAVINLINFINTLPDNNKIFMGISVFRDNSRWLQASSDPSDIVTSTNDFSPHGRLIQAVNYAYDSNLLTGLDNFLNGTTTSCTDGVDCDYNLYFQLPACNNPMTFNAVKTAQSLDGNTSIGSGVMFAEDNLTIPKPENTVQAIILVTDGQPSSAIADSVCGFPYYCAQYTNYCYSNLMSGYNSGLKSIGECEKITQVSGNNVCIPCDVAGTCSSANFCSIYFEQPKSDKKKACLAGNQCYVSGEENYTYTRTYGVTTVTYKTESVGCQNEAFSETACALADQNLLVSENNNLSGRRDPQIPLYMLTIQNTSSAKFVPFRNMFQKYLGDKYFELGNANSLSTKLQEILTDIETSFTTINIRRVTP